MKGFARTRTKKQSSNNDRSPYEDKIIVYVQPGEPRMAFRDRFRGQLPTGQVILDGPENIPRAD